MNAADWMVWRLSRQARPTDVIVVGVATPLALCAALVAREVNPRVTVVVGGALDPDLHDIAETVHDPASLPGRSHGVLGQEALLNHVQLGTFMLQFVSPAQVDSHGQINTVRVSTSGGSRWLAGPLAIPDISAGVGRLVAYRAEHSRRVLVDTVDHVTGSASARSGHGWRSRYRLTGAGVQAIVTSQAEIGWDGAGFSVTGLRDATTLAEVRDGCGFDLGDEVEEATPPEGFLDLLDSIDPSRVRDLEARAAS